LDNKALIKIALIVPAEKEDSAYHNVNVALIVLSWRKVAYANLNKNVKILNAHVIKIKINVFLEFVRIVLI
jgi:hypothetical protein